MFFWESWERSLTDSYGSRGEMDANDHCVCRTITAGPRVVDRPGETAASERVAQIVAAT